MSLRASADGVRAVGATRTLGRDARQRGDVLRLTDSEPPRAHDADFERFRGHGVEASSLLPYRGTVDEYGISGGGREAEELFLRLTGATKVAVSSEGDALLDGHLVEIKQATKNTVNQVRAVKYLPLVVYHRPTRVWYVLPAHEVVRRIAAKARGQHTEIAFECATLNLAGLSEFRLNEARDLRERTIQAIAESSKFPRLKTEMDSVRAQAIELAQESRRRVEAILREPI